MAESNRNTIPDNDVAGVDLLQPLIALSKSTRQLVSLKLAETGVMAGQDQLLDALDPREQRSICMVANHLSVRPSTVSKMLDILERRGWCQREADDVDLRRTFVRLTPEGERVRLHVRRVWGEVNADLMRQLPSDMVSDMSAALHQVEDVLMTRLSRLR
ncbi:MarR family winged helix-turn-helix transcriptional regulator [Aureimonas ureilytica]|uniref:MarR family winged helix-turn-helix transcriptional regulator n=1 Tax=Aureimonas ureilytica TaxID=401562 RepID=UPI0007347EA2|nr:MarR family transcriptional regulator [Aureimonas ureilytica]